jgi:hypothetical protein
MHKGPEDTRTVTHHWRPQFALPTHGPQGIEETCYTFVYQNARFVVLNSNMRLQEQAEWLDKTLAANTSRWVVCSFHHPIFSTAKDRDNAQLRALWKPILDKYNVDLVLQGHDHTYGRTGLETPHVETVGNVPIGVTHQDKHIGTVYVVSVSGPKMYNIDQKPFMVRVAEDTQLYQLIHIDRDKLRYESRTANGELYDAFELSKVDGKPKSDAGAMLKRQFLDFRFHLEYPQLRYLWASDRIRFLLVFEGLSCEYSGWLFRFCVGYQAGKFAVHKIFRTARNRRSKWRRFAKGLMDTLARWIPRFGHLLEIRCWTRTRMLPPMLTTMEGKVRLSCGLMRSLEKSLNKSPLFRG